MNIAPCTLKYCRPAIFTLVLFFFGSNQIFAQTIDYTSGTDRLKSLAKRKALEENSLVKNVMFRNIGPTIMSGRVVDLDVNPEDPTEFYVAYASGGLWHTKNNGQTFVPIFDNEDAITIGDIAVDWKTRAIWVGTGEVNSSRSSYAGTGIYLSTDTGKTWTNKGLIESHHIGRIILHPTKPGVLWVAVLGHLYSANAERGVYKSTDNGTTWKLVLAVDENTGAVDMDINSRNPDILYAAMWYRERRAWNLIEGGVGSGIYQSLDGGEKWNKLNGGSSGFPDGEGIGRIGLTVSPADPNILYVILDNQNKRNDTDERDSSKIDSKDLKGMSKEKFLKLDDKKLESFLRDNDFPEKYTIEIVKDLVKTDSISVDNIVEYSNDANNSLFDTPIIGAEVYRSDDAGKTWKKTHENYIKNLFYTYGYYFGKINVSPFDANKITVCGLPLLMSTDGGKTFKSIDGDNTHGDHHAVWMSPKRDGHMIIGNDGGLNISYDDGASWFKANTPAVGQFYSVEVDMAKPYNVYGGLQDNGVWTGPSTNVSDVSWQQYGVYPYKFIMGGDGMQVQVDTRDNATVYTGFQFGYYYRLNKNVDGESMSVKPRNNIGENNYRFNWQSPICLSKHNQDILYYGSNHFHRSLLKGEEMKTMSADLTKNSMKGDVPYNTLTTIAESPMRFGLVYAGTDDGMLWVSKDVGYSWTFIADSLPKNLYVSRVSASNKAEGRVYLSMNGYRNDHFEPYVFVSENYGASWKNISMGLPAEPVNVIREDPENENLLFVGTDNGLYVSINRGESWMAMNGGLPRVPVHDAVIHPRDGEIVLGTHGRSFYVASLKEIRQINDSLLGKDLKILEVTAPKFSKSWGADPGFFSKPMIPELSGSYYSKNPGLSTVRILSSNGILLKTVTDTTEAGLNYFHPVLSMEETVANLLSKKIGRTKNPTELPRKSDDGNYYLPEGKYKLEITLASGTKESMDFEVGVISQN
ncbi:MAG: glycosyl hydrolase [Bacteroidetes bacterium]|nr:MAG: glycosyl hydrolase [Bacteroidota bacterium]